MPRASLAAVAPPVVSSPVSFAAEPAPVAPPIAFSPEISPREVPPAPAPVAALPPPITRIPNASLPRADFWVRVAALALDAILVGIVCGFLSDLFPKNSSFHIHADFLPVLAVYAAVMWKIRGTTVGGILCGIRLVRLDDRPIDWTTAIVRALGCFLSLFVVGLGFLWVLFDDERQSWHDKIAGTVIVHAPKGTSLV